MAHNIGEEIAGTYLKILTNVLGLKKNDSSLFFTFIHKASLNPALIKV